MTGSLPAGVSQAHCDASHKTAREIPAPTIIDLGLRRVRLVEGSGAYYDALTAETEGYVGVASDLAATVLANVGNRHQAQALVSLTRTILDLHYSTWHHQPDGSEPEVERRRR